MKNEQKKNYVQPEMTVLDYGYQPNVLLCDSFGEDIGECAEDNPEPVEFN
jgi:hypothetical protein